MSSDIVRALEPVVAALEELGVAYRIGGSVASSALGVPRSTLDVDIVCELGEAQVALFARRLEDGFYMDPDLALEAIRCRSSFNLVHLDTMTKVDVFIRKDEPFDHEVFTRSSRKPLEEGTRAFDLTTAEDIVLRKLEWFRLGGESSERQWNDVLGVIRVQDDALDRTYLQRWAAVLELTDLLARVFAEA